MLSASSNRACSRHHYQRQIAMSCSSFQTFGEEIRSVAPRLLPFRRRQSRFNAHG